MEVSDIIKNYNFTPEFPYVVSVDNDRGDILAQYESWEKEVPDCLLDKEVSYMNVVNGFGYMNDTPVMVIDVFEED